MRIIKKLLLSVASVAILTTGALAADPIITVEPAYIEPIAGFDWDGFYMGVGISGSTYTPALTAVSADIIAGFNVTSGSMLFGAEGWFGAHSDSSPATNWGGGLEARVGALITPDALLYVSGGGQFYDAGGQYGFIGAGAEFAVTDSLTFDLEYKYLGWSNTLYTGHSLGLSALWHF